jgi:hypothetical protein|tara:strand:- start:923 stop:1345 length:423 start_codon:yes stop_codon:yes gene_type:complete
MDRNVENLIQTFVDKYDIVDRSEIVHGTLYVKFTEEKECDFFHKALRTFFRKLDPTGGVNMYAVGDEFAFDFVPEDREAPVFCDETYSGKEEMDPTDTDEKGVWSEFAEEEMFNNLDLTDEEDAELDVLMNLEAESQRGK